MCCTWLCFAKTKIVFIRPIKRSNSNSLTFNNRANNKDKGHLQWDRWVIVIHYSHVWPPLHWKFCMYAFMLCCLFFCVACSDFSMSSFEFKNHSWIQMWIRMNSYSHWMNSYRVKIFTVGKILVQIREFQLFWTYAKKKKFFYKISSNNSDRWMIFYNSNTFNKKNESHHYFVQVLASLTPTLLFTTQIHTEANEFNEFGLCWVWIIVCVNATS